MGSRRLILLLPFLALGAFLLYQAGRPAAPAPAEPSPNELLACPVCRAAASVGLRLEQFKEIRRFRCRPGPTILWPRGKVRRGDLTFVDVDLGSGIWFEGDDVLSVFAVRAGTRVLYREGVSLELLISEHSAYVACMPYEPGPENFLAHGLSKGLRMVLPSQVGVDVPPPPAWFQVHYDREDVALRTPLLRVHQEHAELSARRAELQAAVGTLPSWIVDVLEAQLLYDARYVMAAHEKARAVLDSVPNEPHAVALIYTCYLRVGLAPSEHAQRFGSVVQEPLQAMRRRAQMACELERRDRGLPRR